MSRKSKSTGNKEFHYAYSFSGKVDAVIIPIQVSKSGDSEKIECQALIDTGSNKCCIAKDFAKFLGLTSKNTGLIFNTGIENGVKRPIYLVDIILSKDIVYNNVEVLETANLPSDLGKYSVLIGMNIIKTGNLSIESISGKTKIDFKVIKP